MNIKTLNLNITINGIDYTEKLASIGKITSVDGGKAISATSEIGITLNDADKSIYLKILNGTLYNKNVILKKDGY